MAIWAVFFIALVVPGVAIYYLALSTGRHRLLRFVPWLILCAATGLLVASSIEPNPSFLGALTAIFGLVPAAISAFLGLAIATRKQTPH